VVSTSSVLSLLERSRRVGVALLVAGVDLRFIPVTVTGSESAEAFSSIVGVPVRLRVCRPGDLGRSGSNNHPSMTISFDGPRETLRVHH